MRELTLHTHQHAVLESNLLRTDTKVKCNLHMFSSTPFASLFVNTKGFSLHAMLLFDRHVDNFHKKAWFQLSVSVQKGERNSNATDAPD